MRTFAVRVIVVILGLIFISSSRVAGAEAETIYSAAREGDVAAVTRLLDADPTLLNAGDPQFGGTPLHWAAVQGKDAVVTLLLERGADLNLTNNDGRTPLHLAAAQGHLAVATLLVGKGAVINAQDKDGNTPLHFAAATGSKAIVELLLARQADTALRNKAGRTASEWAWAEGFSEIAKMLDDTILIEVDPGRIIRDRFLGFGVEWDSNSYNDSGVTAQDFAVIRKRIAWMRLPIARIMMQSQWCYKGNGRYDWNDPQMKALYRHLDVCQQLGITVLLTDWGIEPAWLTMPEVSKVEDPKYAGIIATYLDHLLNAKGYTCIKYFILVNEPNLEVRDWNRWKKGIENLAAALHQKGLAGKVTLIGSDQSGGDDWHRNAVDQLQNILGAYDIHRYAPEEAVTSGSLFDYYRTSWAYVQEKDPGGREKPLVVAEAGIWSPGFTAGNNPLHLQYRYGVLMADYAVQAANAGSWAVLAWMLDDNSHRNFTWGMWKSKANGLAFKPWFYPWSLLTRSFRPGAVIVEARTFAKDVRVLAAYLDDKASPGTRSWTFCIVNRSAAAKTIRLYLAGGPRIELRRYVYSPTSAKTDGDGFPVALDTRTYHLGAGADIPCEGNSVVILTTANDGSPDRTNPAARASVQPLTRRQVLDQVMLPYAGPVERGVDARTLVGKVMCGYQGWHAAEGDAAGRGWYHWQGRNGFKPGSCCIDLWPDVSELDADERYPTAFRLANGQPAEVFSAVNTKTVLRHFQWMKQYGIDGVFVQRFAGEVSYPAGFCQFTQVLANCREGANRTGRVYAVMYDLSGTTSDRLPLLMEDWKLLVDRMRITEDPAYLHYRERPIVAIWGVGFNDGRKYTLDDISRLIAFFKDDPRYGNCSVMLGVPAGWRELNRDCVNDPAMHDLLRRVDIISPWNVGRYGTPEEVVRTAETIWTADLAWCTREDKLYLPVVFPGFSWHNMKPDSPLNQIPRLKGRFLWSQYAAAQRVGAKAVYQAMFDEVDEGTAIYKCTNDPPVGASRFLDYEGLPSDYYLRLVGYATRMLRGALPWTEQLPNLWID